MTMNQTVPSTTERQYQIKTEMKIEHDSLDMLVDQCHSELDIKEEFLYGPAESRETYYTSYSTDTLADTGATCRINFGNRETVEYEEITKHSVTSTAEKRNQIKAEIEVEHESLEMLVNQCHSELDIKEEFLYDPAALKEECYANYSADTVAGTGATCRMNFENHQTLDFEEITKNSVNLPVNEPITSTTEKQTKSEIKLEPEFDEILIKQCHTEVDIKEEFLFDPAESEQECYSNNCTDTPVNSEISGNDCEQSNSNTATTNAKENITHQKKENESKSAVDRIFECTKCPKIFVRKQYLNRHMRSHSGEKPFKCVTCTEVFTLKSSLDRHMRIHTGIKPFKCSICSKSFTQNSHLADHVRSHTGKKLFECLICSRSFTQNQYLVDHSRVHTGEKPYKCLSCNTCFRTASNLRYHLRIHSNEKPFKCPVCNKAFRKKSHLVTHERIHSNMRPYQCSTCGKGFNQKCHLDTHIGIHTGAKPYKCSTCNKCFRFESNLYRHGKIHTNEKPYKCSVCNKAFNQKSHLNTHERIHTGKKLYDCSICKRSFSQNTHLAKHIRTHAVKKPFQCAICNKGLKHKATLKKHMRMHSNE